MMEILDNTQKNNMHSVSLLGTSTYHLLHNSSF